MNQPTLDAKQQQLLQSAVMQDELQGGEITPPQNTPSLELNDSAGNVSLKEKIKKLEEELAGIDSTTHEKADPKTWQDEYGNETFFVKNISGTHVCIAGDLDIPKIPIGKVFDLTEFATVEELKKSRDIKKATSWYEGTQLLKRITEQEYYEEKKAEVAMRKKIEIMRNQEQLKAQQLQQNMNPAEAAMHNPVAQSALPATRADIQAKLGKLALMGDPDPENRLKAMTSIEFIEWANNQNFSLQEIDFILSDPYVFRSHDIRAALITKRASIPQ
jgi:hypothetical protein